MVRFSFILFEINSRTKEINKTELLLFFLLFFKFPFNLFLMLTICTNKYLNYVFSYKTLQLLENC